MLDQKIVDIIAAHRCRERGMACDEGEVWCDGCGEVVNVDDVAAHQLNALRGNGIAVVELPEPECVTDNTAGWAGWTWAVNRNVGVVIVDMDSGGGAVNPDQARNLAAALLAAAEHAEREQ